LNFKLFFAGYCKKYDKEIGGGGVVSLIYGFTLRVGEALRDGWGEMSLLSPHIKRSAE